MTMNKYFFTILMLITLAGSFFAQPNIRIEPRNIRFEDVFNRYDYAIIYNDGDQPLSIDSLSPTKQYYILDFEEHPQLPFIINPGDTIKLNVTLTNFYNITVSDTTDTIWVYSNDPESPRDLRIKIDFFDDDYGNCSGTISDEILTPLPDSKIYFFYYGIYLFDSTFTDVSGNYNIQLPKGDYTVAAEKEGYRIIFSGNTTDPFFAQSVQLDSGQSVNVDLALPVIKNSGFSVSGVVINSISGITMDRGVVIIRKGTHTPTLLKPKALIADSSVYAGFVKSDGSYNIIVEDSTYYFIQGYSEYFLPTYFNNQNSTSVFWQNADSVFINQSLLDKNLYLERDSSFGGGGAYGSITLPFLEAQGFDGITVLAKSLDNDQLYSYNFGKEDGKFKINNLPYGSYQLVAQKVGLPNALSNTFTISPKNQSQYNLDIQFSLTTVEEGTIVPNGIILYPNYPNPFNPTTILRFYLPERNYVRLRVFDALGKEVMTLVNEEKLEGNYQVEFQASFGSRQLASGIYYYQLQAGSFVETKKMILLK